MERGLGDLTEKILAESDVRFYELFRSIIPVEEPQPLPSEPIGTDYDDTE